MMSSFGRAPERRQVASEQTQESLPRREVTLYLQQGPSQQQQQNLRHVSWDSSVQEHPNQHVSKSCCVFHKKKLFGESSSDESSSTDDSDSGGNAAGDAGENPCQGDCTASQNAQEHHSHRHRKRPPCTKEHCYCGTRFR